uniref:ubiquitinyl hydrolase 1 n=1 Tax=Leptocylindrus danicus TaxID=163516 RepID=A0A7S2KZG2_9STRA|mmetsp:Transcript_29279/g.42995  ORF Transcript_29279/g.42995 Transcript_29279/m.42995 type:complete len:234 (+) Transcript_29279:260-961(+)
MSKLSNEQQIDSVQLESQRLQLCAVHAINNLLQVSNEENAATKEELDSIADSLVTKEKAIYRSGKESISGANSMSWYDLLKSRHRTPMLGNYSFEVLSLALRKRGIELNWCDVKDIENIVTGKCSPHNAQACSSSIVGFIVNSVSPRLHYFSLGLFGRHWFAITKSDGFEDNHCAVAMEDKRRAERWTILDSKKQQPDYLDSSDALISYLELVHDKGGAIFHAKPVSSVYNSD